MSGSTTARHAFPFLSAGQAQKEVTHNEALSLLDAGLHAAAEAFGLNAPPTSPDIGQCWIIGSSPTGAWVGHAHALAAWTGGGWRFLPPIDGLCVWLRDQQLWAVHASGAWAVGDVRAQRLLVGGQQIVGARLPTVALPAGGSTIDAEARSAIETIIARLTVHGLIAP